MYEIKKTVYLYFDKTQKSALCNYLRALVKQNLKNPEKELFDKFFENEKYYLEINNSRFPFIEQFINEEQFINDTKKYIAECKKYYEYKEKQRPVIEANKAFEKKKRKFLQEVKMSKEMPTQKQIYYYEKLCKKYNLEKKETEELSKLDLKNEIESIINEHSTNY